jgi:hypothetical protein
VVTFQEMPVPTNETGLAGGIGLPKCVDFQNPDRERLKEPVAPYVTSREKAGGEGVEAVLELVKKQNEY